MIQYDVEAFMAACERKGLAAKTMGSYEQTLRLFGQFLSVREIERTEEVKRVHIESYISKFSEYRDSVIMQTLLDTGMRCGEYLAVTEKDLNLQKL